MKAFIILCLSISISLTSCTKEDNEEVLSGVYVEISPVQGRMELQFLKDNTVVLTKESGSRDKFNYELREDVLILIPEWDPSISTEHDLEIINGNKIRLGNMLPGFPEMPDTPVVFVKN